MPDSPTLAQLTAQLTAQQNSFSTQLADDPAAMVKQAGIQLADADVAGFNAYVRAQLQPKMGSSFDCDICKVGFYPVSATIYGIGQATLATLPTTSAIVTQVAQFFNASPAQALQALQDLATMSDFSISEINDMMCSTLGPC